MFNTTTGCYSLADIAAAAGGSNRSNDDGWGGNGGAWWIIILFLFCFAGWGGNGRGFFGNGGGSTGSGITDGYILTSDFANIERKLDGVNNGICDGFYAMNTGMLNGFANLNTALVTSHNGLANAIQADTVANMQNTNAITSQIQDCCCQNEKLTMQSNYDAAMRACATDNMLATQFANLNYNLADQSCTTRRTITDSTRDIIDNQNAGIRSILDFLTQDKLTSLTAENTALKNAASNAAQTAAIISELKPCPSPAYVVPNPYCCYGNNYYNNGCGC